MNIDDHPVVPPAQWLDLTPGERDDDGLSFTQSWVRHRDAYGA